MIEIDLPANIEELRDDELMQHVVGEDHELHFLDSYLSEIGSDEL